MERGGLPEPQYPVEGSRFHSEVPWTSMLVFVSGASVVCCDSFLHQRRDSNLKQSGQHDHKAVSPGYTVQRGPASDEGRDSSCGLGSERGAFCRSCRLEWTNATRLSMGVDSTGETQKTHPSDEKKHRLEDSNTVVREPWICDPPTSHRRGVSLLR